MRCVAFDPQKPNILASCSDDKTIKIWDIESGACQSTLADDKPVACVAFSTDGSTIAAGEGYKHGSSEYHVRLYDVQTGEVKSTLNVDGEVSSLDFSPCGTKIAAACNDYNNDNYTVKILGSSSESAGTFECESTLTGHNATVTQVEFIDADTVVSSSRDGTTRAWDVATGTYKAEFEGDKFSFTRSSGAKQTVGA